MLNQWRGSAICLRLRRMKWTEDCCASSCCCMSRFGSGLLFLRLRYSFNRVYNTYFVGDLRKCCCCCSFVCLRRSFMESWIVFLRTKWWSTHLSLSDSVTLNPEAASLNSSSSTHTVARLEARNPAMQRRLMTEALLSSFLCFHLSNWRRRRRSVVRRTAMWSSLLLSNTAY